MKTESQIICLRTGALKAHLMQIISGSIHEIQASDKSELTIQIKKRTAPEDKYGDTATVEIEIK